MTDFVVITEPQIAEFAKSTRTITEYYPTPRIIYQNKITVEAKC